MIDDLNLYATISVNDQGQRIGNYSESEMGRAAAELDRVYGGWGA